MKLSFAVFASNRDIAQSQTLVANARLEFCKSAGIGLEVADGLVTAEAIQVLQFTFDATTGNSPRPILLGRSPNLATDRATWHS